VPDGPGLGIEVDEKHLESIRSTGKRLKQMHERHAEAH
jgi:hypothetical protein